MTQMTQSKPDLGLAIMGKSGDICQLSGRNTKLRKITRLLYDNPQLETLLTLLAGPWIIGINRKLLAWSWRPGELKLLHTTGSGFNESKKTHRLAVTVQGEVAHFSNHQDPCLPWTNRENQGRI